MLLARPAPFVLFGIALMLLGLCCLLLPQIAAVSAALLAGSALLVGGLLALGHWRLTRGWPGAGASLASGLAFVAVGLLMLILPGTGVALVASLLALFLFFDGFTKLMLGLAIRGIPGGGWNLFHGVVSLLLAGMVFSRWPTSATWVIGLVAGAHLMIKGWAMLMLGLSARSLLATR
ncbi:MAG: hypothetical protein RLZZ303_2910 [Candidatus Hydrogenedentota bacterium]|jgi:uncharacterized membrane protein HdeD (DUF308 family)